MCSWFGRAAPGDRYHSLHPALWNAKKLISPGRWEEERAGTCHRWAVCFFSLGCVGKWSFLEKWIPSAKGKLVVSEAVNRASSTQPDRVMALCKHDPEPCGQGRLGRRAQGDEDEHGQFAHRCALMVRWGTALHTDMMIYRVLKWFLNNCHPQTLNCWGDINITGKDTRIGFMGRHDVSSAQFFPAELP